MFIAHGKDNDAFISARGKNWGLSDLIFQAIMVV